MSFEKYGQVRITDKKLWQKFLDKLSEEGMSQQGFFLSKIKKFVGPKKRKRKRISNDQKDIKETKKNKAVLKSNV